MKSFTIIKKLWGECGDECFIDKTREEIKQMITEALEKGYFVYAVYLMRMHPITEFSEWEKK